MFYQPIFGAFLVTNAIAAPQKPANENSDPCANGSKLPWYEIDDRFCDGGMTYKEASFLERCMGSEVYCKQNYWTVEQGGPRKQYQNEQACRDDRVKCAKSAKPAGPAKQAKFGVEGELPWRLIDQKQCPNYTGSDIQHPSNLEACYGTQRYCDEAMWEEVLGQVAEHHATYADSEACLKKRRLPDSSWNIADETYCPKDGQDPYDGSVDLARCHGTQKYCDERKWGDVISLIMKKGAYDDPRDCLTSHLSSWFPGPPPPKDPNSAVNLSLFLSLQQVDVTPQKTDEEWSQPIPGKLLFREGRPSVCARPNHGPNGTPEVKKSYQEFCLGTVKYCERTSKDQVACIKERVRPVPKFYPPIEECRRDLEICMGTEKYCNKAAFPKGEECVKLRQA